MSHGSGDRYYSQHYKKFLEMILQQLPRYVKQYPASEKRHLEAFIEVLKGYKVDTQKAREALTAQLIQFSQYCRSQEVYYQLPFLWFVDDYFSNATRLLSVASFYGKDFYSYLVNHLRGDSKVRGAFPLIKDATPLTNLKWEQLQYSCVKLQNPLTKDELQLLNVIHSNQFKDPTIDFLSNEKIKVLVSEQTQNSKLIRQLKRFLTRLDARWRLWEYRPAFGVEQIIFNFFVNESYSLFEIIDFQDPQNVLLCTSDIYQVKNIPNLFHGTLYLPSRNITELFEYLEECERRGKIRLNFLERVVDTKRTHSYALYRPDTGWYHLSETKKEILARRLRVTTPRKRKDQKKSFYLSPEFNKSWHYTKFSDPLEAIKLYCNDVRVFAYKDLLDGSKGIIREKYSDSNLEILKELRQKKVIQVGFDVDNLLREYSLDYFLVKIPTMPFHQLSRLLNWLPMSSIFFTETSIYIRTYLTPDLVKWIKDVVQWPIMAINLHFPFKKRNFNQMFDEKGCEWKVPIILKK